MFKVYGSYLYVYFSYEGLVGGHVLLSDYQWSFHVVVLVVTGPLLNQAKFSARSVFILFYTTGTKRGKFNSSFIWHNPHTFTVDVLSLPVLFGDPTPTTDRFDVIAVLINQPKVRLPPPSNIH